MPQPKARQLGVVRSPNSLTESLMIATYGLVTATTDGKKSRRVKADGFGTTCEKKQIKTKDSEDSKIVSVYECQHLSELEHLKITILELQAKLQDKSRVLTEAQKKRKEENLRYQNIIEEMTKAHDLTKEELSCANLALNAMNDKLYNTEKEAKERLDILKEVMEKEKADQLEEKDAEIAWQKEKMNSLKKQICDTLTGNSLIRQQQLDEMSKELVKVNDEALRLKLQMCKTAKVTKTDDKSCPECKNKLMAMKLKDIEIDQLQRRIKFGGIEQRANE